MIVPAWGWGKLKTYGPAPLPVTTSANSPLTPRSVAATPVTGSLKVILMEVREDTAVPDVGTVTETTGAASPDISLRSRAAEQSRWEMRIKEMLTKNVGNSHTKRDRSGETPVSE